MGLCRISMSVGMVVVLAACSRREDDRSITAAPERAGATSASAPSAPQAAPGDDTAAANPLAMPLKHDGPAPAASGAAKDPCDVTEPTGALAMPLKHGAKPQRNPLCMKLK